MVGEVAQWILSLWGQCLELLHEVGEEGRVETAEAIDLKLSLDEGAEDELGGLTRVGLPFLIRASESRTDEDRLPTMQEEQLHELSLCRGNGIGRSWGRG